MKRYNLIKKAKTTLMIWAFAVPVLLHAQEQSTAPAQAKAANVDASEAWKAVRQHEAELKAGTSPQIAFQKKTPLERHRILSQIRGSRKFDVRPVKQTDGIKTGVVMVYGHVIPAPYKIEYIGNKLFVNGIQVEPSLVRERDIKEHPIKTLPPEKQAVEQKAGRLIRDAKKIYEDGKGTAPSSVLHQQILDMLAKHSNLIQNPKWQGEELCYTTPNYGFGQCVGFGPSMFSPSEVQAKHEAAGRKENLHMLESELADGKWVCFGSEGMWVPRKVDGAEVKRIVNDSSLSRDQKIEALNNSGLNSYVLAEDILDNYVAGEWSIK